MAYGSSQLGVKSEIQLQAYTTAAAMQDPSHIYSSQQSRITDPLSKARDKTRILMDTSQVNHWATTGMPLFSFFKLETVANLI